MIWNCFPKSGRIWRCIKLTFFSLIAKESDKDLTTWETYLKEKKQKKKKKMKEASKAQESEEDTSEIVILINYILAFTSDVSYCSQEEKKKIIIGGR